MENEIGLELNSGETIFIPRSEEEIRLIDENHRLAILLYRVGICSQCEEQIKHDVDEPFAYCACGTTEDPTGPGLIQQRDILIGAADEKIFQLTKQLFDAKKRIESLEADVKSDFWPLA